MRMWAEIGRIWGGYMGAIWGLYGGYEFGEFAKMSGLDDWIGLLIVPFWRARFAALSDFLM